MKSSAFAFSYLNLSHCRARPTYEKLRTRLIQSILYISEVPWSADVTMDVHCKIMTTNSITAAAFPDTCQMENITSIGELVKTYTNIQAIELSESRIFIKSRHCRFSPVAYLLGRHLQTQATSNPDSKPTRTGASGTLDDNLLTTSSLIEEVSRELLVESIPAVRSPEMIILLKESGTFICLNSQKTASTNPKRFFALVLQNLQKPDHHPRRAASRGVMPAETSRLSLDSLTICTQRTARYKL